MTVTHFLNDYYIGKYVSFIISERKEDERVRSRREVDCYPFWLDKNWDGSFTDWEKKHYGDRSDQPFYERYLKACDKVIGIKRFMSYWYVSTLYGYTIKLTADDELPIVDPKDQSQTVITESLKAV